MFSEVTQTFIQALHHRQEAFRENKLVVWVIEHPLRCVEKGEEGQAVGELRSVGQEVGLRSASLAPLHLVY